MPRVHPENDILGSYGTKLYNNSCASMEMDMRNKGLDVPSDAYLRTCPVGVKSCFGATGFYDHKDKDPSNDLST